MTGLGLDADRAAMGIDDRPRDRQPESGASTIPRAAAVDAVKAFEDPLELGRGNTGSGVADGDLEPVAAGARAHLDAVLRLGVGDGVANQVAQHLRQPVGIGDQRPPDPIDPEVAFAKQRQIPS